MNVLGWIIFGALAGWVSGLIVRSRRGCIVNIVVGILGALLGGFIYRIATGESWSFDWDWASFGVAVLGAVLLLAILTVATPRSRR